MSPHQTYAVVAAHQLDLPTGTAFPGERVKLTPDEAAPFVADGHLLAVEGMTSQPRTQIPPVDPDPSGDDGDSTRYDENPAAAEAPHTHKPKKPASPKPATTAPDTGDAS